MVHNTVTELLGFWTLFTVGNSKYSKTQHFRNRMRFRLQMRERQTPTLLGPLESAVQNVRLALFEGPNRVGVSLLSPEDGSRSSFRNVVFVFRIPDVGQSPETLRKSSPSRQNT
jgi:hypothetical protein